MKKAKAVLGYALLFYIFLVGFLYFYQGNLLYHPDTTRPDPIDGSVVVEAVTADNIKLNAAYFSPKNPSDPVILFFHGNSGNISSRAYKLPTFLNEGLGVLLAEYRGYGGNAGEISEDGLYEDARAYMRWLNKEQGIKAEQVILYGESLGTGVAVQMATEYDVKALILEAPYNALPDVAKQTYYYVPVNLLMKDQYRSIDKIKDVSAPILILHGDNDQVISINLSKKLFVAANEPKIFVTIPGAGHNNLYDMGAPLHIQEFLRNIMER